MRGGGGGVLIGYMIPICGHETGVRQRVGMGYQGKGGDDGVRNKYDYMLYIFIYGYSPHLVTHTRHRLHHHKLLNHCHRLQYISPFHLSKYIQMIIYDVRNTYPAQPNKLAMERKGYKIRYRNRRDKSGSCIDTRLHLFT